MGCEQRNPVKLGVTSGKIVSRGEFSCGNIFVRPIHLYKDEEIGGHVHNFDHMTIVIKGSVSIDRFTVSGESLSQNTVLDTGQFALIEASLVHKIKALENETVVFCIYSHRNAQGEVVQKYSGFERAYQ